MSDPKEKLPDADRELTAKETSMLIKLAKLARKAVQQGYMTVPKLREVGDTGIGPLVVRRSFVERQYKGYQRVWCVETTVGEETIYVYRSGKTVHGDISADVWMMFGEKEGKIIKFQGLDLTDCRRLYKQLREQFLLDAIADV